MTKEQWDRLKGLFHAALECEAAERAAFIDEHCASDAVLRQHLERMLASREQFPDFMEPPSIADLSASATVSAPLDGEDRLAPGDLLDRKYRIERRIGSGGMGVVYQVLHTGLGRVFAAKVIQGGASEDPRFLHRFRVEAEALGGLQHPNILNVTDFGIDRDRGFPYLVTEYLQGETLATRLRRSGPLPVETALPLFEAMGAAIDHAHQQGILHLDLKPGNVFLVPRDGSDQVKILDFGLAHVMRGDESAANRERDNRPSMIGFGFGDAPSLRLGTPVYMAPELVHGKPPLKSSDVYAFGVLAYEVLTGRRPFEGSVAQLFESHVFEAPAAPSHVHAPLPPELDAAVLSPLEKDPAARPATVADAVAHLRERSIKAALRTWRHEEVPRRMLWAACLGLLSLLILPAVSRIDLIEGFEGRSLDARFASVPERSPDPRILLLAIDDDSLQKESTLLGAQGDQIGVQLQGVALAGARGIAIDLLLPETWARSEGFSQLVLRHEKLLTLAALSTLDGKVIGPECVAGATTAALGADRAAALFGFVNATEDPDGVHRRYRLAYETDDGQSRPSWAARAASIVTGGDGTRATHTFWIDRSVDWTRIERVSWKDVARELAARPDRFHDRLVLMGATYAGSGDDDVRLSSQSDAVVPGLILHALATETILSDFRVRDVRRSNLLAGIALTVAAVSAALLCIARFPVALLLVALVFLAYGAVAFLLFVGNRIVLPVAGPLVTVAAIALLTLTLRVAWLRSPPGAHREGLALTNATDGVRS